MTAGIYIIKNKQNDKIYVGMSSNIEYRWETHCNTNPIDAAIEIEGEDNFECFIIEEMVQNDNESNSAFRKRMRLKEYDYMKKFNIVQGCNHHYNKQCIIDKKSKQLSRKPPKQRNIKKWSD